MGETKIEWTNKVWNPIRGCSRVSEGCRNCYAETRANRFKDPGLPYEGLIAKGGQWNGQIAVVPQRFTDPLHWRKPRRVFVNSMSDLFHENVPDRIIDEIFAVMALCPQHTFQILTKRPQRMREYLTGHAAGGRHIWQAGQQIEMPKGRHKPDPVWPLPNVWLGVSVEDQATAGQRIVELLKTPAAVRWISAEPLLGPINLREIAIGDEEFDCLALPSWGELIDCWRDTAPEWQADFMDWYDLSSMPNEADYPLGHKGLDWVVAGGESGKNARPMHPDWARSLRDQCVNAGVPFFFKQWGEWAPGEAVTDLPTRTERIAELFGDRWWFGKITPSYAEGMHRDDEPDLYRVGKKRAGRTLDGRMWDEYPANSEVTT